MDGSGTSPSQLLCGEDFSWLKQEQEGPNGFSFRYLEDDEDEYIEKLIREDPGFGSVMSISYFWHDDPNKRWVKPARLSAVEWILRTRAFLGFEIRSAYLSVIYLDRFLARKTLVKEDRDLAVQLLSIACLSLAAKMEEILPPKLSEYPSEVSFDCGSIQGAEIEVLITLEWRLVSVTPFIFFRYFVTKFFYESNPQKAVPIAVDLIMTAIKGINLRAGGASIIAAAAVLAAFDTELSRKTVELKTSLIPNWGSRENEHIFCCYDIMKEILMVKFKTPKLVLSPNVPSYFGSSSEVIGHGTKRRIEFNDHDDNSRAEKTSRK